MKLLPTFIATIFFLLFTAPVFGVENPLSSPNNKFGIHILFPEEVIQAASLVNSNGGEWGYVTIPIQAGDKDLVKWQLFLDSAKKYHVIPIIRLATEGDYFNTKVWRKPEAEDVLDFANFLSSLDWPTKNKYIVIFNEVNRGDEWGGSPNAEEYAQILSYATEVFKNKSQDFFIISSGLDNAAQTQEGQFINQYDFLRLMHASKPSIFNALDGLGSHSYPNPGFRQPPSNLGQTSIVSFRYERELVKQLSGQKLPIFITETGWSSNAVPQQSITSYYEEAFSTIWSDSSVVAITPFLLRAGTGAFSAFSLMGNNGQEQVYSLIEKLPKIKGQPVLSPITAVFGDNLEAKVLGVREFSKVNYTSATVIKLPNSIKILARWLLKIE